VNLAIEAAELGPPRSPDAMVRRCLPLVWWTVRSAGVPDESIEDVVHDVFVALLGPRSHAPGDLPFERWVAGVARSVAFSHRRSHARRRARLQALPESSPAPASDELLAGQRAWSDLAAFLETLADDQREAFVLVELHGSSAPEVAELLGVKLNTVYARVRLARGKLQRWLDGAGARRELASYLREASVAGAPPSATRDRTCVRVVGTLALADAGTAVGGVGAAAVGVKSGVTLAAIGAAVIGGVLGLGVVVRGGGDGDAIEAAPVHAGVAAPEPTEARARPPERGEISPHSIADPVAPLPVVVQTVAPETGAVPTRVEATAAPAGLAADLAVLDAADAALQRDAPKEALTVLERHASDAPASPLAPERAVLRVRALCALGRNEEAARLAETWRARKDLPRIAEALDRTCAVK
jgi:RNA polymerase sigma factor (sigma-70 family)